MGLRLRTHSRLVTKFSLQAGLLAGRSWLSQCCSRPSRLRRAADSCRRGCCLIMAACICPAACCAHQWSVTVCVGVYLDWPLTHLSTSVLVCPWQVWKESL